MSGWVIVDKRVARGTDATRVLGVTNLWAKRVRDVQPFPSRDAAERIRDSYYDPTRYVVRRVVPPRVNRMRRGERMLADMVDQRDAAHSALLRIHRIIEELLPTARGARHGQKEG